MKERGPAIDAVVGGDDEKKKKVIEEAEAMRQDQALAYEDVGWGGNDPEKHAREKTAEEFEMIAAANEVTDALRARYGLGPREVSAENVHFIERDGFLFKFKDGSYVPSRQSIELGEVADPEKSSKTQRTRILVHEMIHMKSYNAQVVRGGAEAETYRVGLDTFGADGGRFLTMLNEAVTDELTLRCMRQLEKTDPELGAEAAERDRLASEHPEELEEGVIHIREKDGLFGKKLQQEKLGYIEEVQALNILIDKLHAKFPHDFKEREEVFDLFGKAAMTGKMLVLARVMTKAFGDGIFRKIAEANPKGENTLLKIVESL